MGLCAVFVFYGTAAFLFYGSAALRLGTEPVDGQRTFTVTVQLIRSQSAGSAIPVLLGRNQGELLEGEPKVLSGLVEGEIVSVEAGSDSCSYKAGQKMTTCFLQCAWRVVFKSQVEDTLKLNVLVTRTGSGTGPSFDVKINDVTECSDLGTIAEGKTFWRIIPVDGAGVVATVLFHPTNTNCTYTVANSFDKETCELDGWKIEFETMLSKPYTGDDGELIETNDAGWKTHLLIEGSGPRFDIFLDNDKKYSEGPHYTTNTVSVRLFDAEINQTVKFVFGGDDEHYTYRVGDQKQTFQNLKGYNIDLETIPKENN